LARVGADLPGNIRVVVIRGAGPTFSAGLDRRLLTAPADGSPALLALAALEPHEFAATLASYQAGFGWLSRPDLTSVAVVQGHAVGAGFQLALACDLRLLSDDAVFTMAEPGLGLVPDLGGTKRLVELIGYSRALEACLTGRRIGAVEAVRIGLGSAVVSAETLDSVVEQTVSSLLAVSRDAAIETKALLLAAAGRDQLAQERAEREAQYRRLRELAGFLGED
jgi:enoyl-CoA hydratase/carnithine racemase